jgi:hypothetical protein
MRRLPHGLPDRRPPAVHTSWSQLDQWFARADSLLPAGTVPTPVLVPSSRALRDSLESIINRSSPDNTPNTDARSPWNLDCGAAAVWTLIDVHHRAAGAYAIELNPYPAWSLDLRGSRNPMFGQSDRLGTMPAPMPTKELQASLRAGRLVSLGSQAIYGFTTDQMRAWLMSDQEEPPSLLQRRGVTLAGDFCFRPSSQHWATSMRDIERRGEGILEILVNELVGSLAVLRRRQEIIPSTGLDVHWLRSAIAAGRGEDVLLAVGIGRASVVAVALPDMRGRWQAHTHFIDVDPWTSDRLDGYCRLLSRDEPTFAQGPHTRRSSGRMEAGIHPRTSGAQ